MENNQNAQHNTCSILGFIFSFLFALVGLILSIIGLNKAKKEGNKKGLAIAGIIISILNMILAVIIVLVVSIPSVIGATNSARQAVYNNSIAVIENYVQNQYSLCTLTHQNFDAELLDYNNCNLNSDYSTTAITNSGVGTDKISYVKIEINNGKAKVIDAADGTGNFKGAKFNK